MTPLAIEGFTHALTARCTPVGFARRLLAIKLRQCVITRWEPTPRELETLNRGGSVELLTWGRQYPVKLTCRDHECADADAMNAAARQAGTDG